MDRLIENSSPQESANNGETVIAEEICETDSTCNLGTDFDYNRKIVWFNVFGFVVLHVGALYGLYKGFTEAKTITVLWAMAILWLSGLGITLGAHRLWTHRSFRAVLSLQIVLMILQTVAGQNCIWIWVRDHRQHHRYADTDADPHNVRRGFFFSHMGWLMSRKHPLVIKMGHNINMEDLNADPIVMFQKKYYNPLYFLLAIYIPVAIPVYFGNETWSTSLLICYFTRYIIALHTTWSVNSIAHIYGYKPFDKNILAVESSFVSLVTSGEGWHNYHHVFPWDYKAAELGTPLQVSTHVIDALAHFGLAYDLKQAPTNMVNMFEYVC
ncbi:acyl-CoA Delta-9 desaturase-like [Arctopsyche grandis]|uniref:acyl-CoA Delta-9 desaturase-like n=1 Tax=Arctopsyche grandis TaxID=121162 RepID=UPI00406D8D9E